MESDLPICVTCAVQRNTRPAVCPICADERQYVGYQGQRWTTLTEMADDGHRCTVRELEPGLLGVGVEPAFGIGQRSLVVATPDGTVLWDPTGFVDDAAVAAVLELGAPRAIAVSHPHFYGVMGDWSAALDVPVLLPRADERWLPRDDLRVQWWEDEVEPLTGVRVIRCGGHFDGSAVLHWAGGAEGDGALLVGDTATVVPDRRHVSMMWSYPNHVPLSPREVERIGELLLERPFRKIYGAWWHRVIEQDGHGAIRRSVVRYVDRVRGRG